MLLFLESEHCVSIKMATQTSTQTPVKRPNKDLDDVVTPTRTKLRRHFNAPDICRLEDIEKSIAAQFPNLKTEVVTYQTEKRRPLIRCLLVTRKVKEYAGRMGPFDAVRLVVYGEGCFKLYVYDKVIEEGASLEPIDSTVEGTVLFQMNDDNMACCPGVSEYSEYLSTIGYTVKSAQVCYVPPDHVRDSSCKILYNKNPTQHSNVCHQCLKLKKHLNKLAKDHKSISSSDKERRTESSSTVPFKYLSPASKEEKMKHRRAEINDLRFQTKKLLAKINQYEFEEQQAQDISILINTINGSENGRKAFEDLCNEAEATAKERGNLLKAIWNRDTESLRDFHKDQETNSKLIFIAIIVIVILNAFIIGTGATVNKWSPITIRIGIFWFLYFFYFCFV